MAGIPANDSAREVMHLGMMKLIPEASARGDRGRSSTRPARTAQQVTVAIQAAVVLEDAVLGWNRRMRDTANE